MERDVKRRTLQTLIDKLSITEFSASDILLESDHQHALSQEHDLHHSTRLILGKTMKVGDKEIERGQIVTRFRFGKRNKVVAEIVLNYSSDERKLLASALSPIRNVLAKLVLSGTFEVTDELVSWIVKAYKVLKTIKICSEEQLLQQLTSRGIEQLVSKKSQIQTIYINQCQHLVEVKLESDNLRKVALLGMKQLQSISLSSKRLERVLLEWNHSSKSNVLGSLARSLRFCSETLRQLSLVAELEISEVKQLRLVELKRLESLCIKVTGGFRAEDLAYFPSGLRTLDVCCESVDDQALQVMSHYFEGLRVLLLRKVHVSSEGLAKFLKAAHVSQLHLHCETVETLHIQNSELTTLEISECCKLNELRIDCPNLSTISIKNCYSLEHGNFSVVGSDLTLDQVMTNE